MVNEVLPRRSELADPAIANIDQVLLVFSLDRPAWDGQMATRFLVGAEAADLPVIVLLNKADLVPPAFKAAVTSEATFLSKLSQLILKTFDFVVMPIST